MLKLISRLFSRDSRPASRPSLKVEPLEDRSLLANYLLLDYSPDSIAGERVRANDFVSAFSLRRSDGLAPAFLDVDGDRFITRNDQTLMASQIANRTAAIFRGFNANVFFGDVFQNSHMGLSWMQSEYTNPQNRVYVMYV